MNTINKISDILNNLSTKYFIDIGASNSTDYSQTEMLLENGWSGIMCECNPEKYVPLKDRLRDKKVNIISEKITVENVLSILKQNNVPNNFYLSLDIDGYDYFVLEKILSEYEPSLIISEINEKIPAGIKFSVLYDENYWWDGSHFYGYSISMLEDLLQKYSYKIQELDYNNVVLIKGKQEQSIEEIYKKGYYNKPDRRYHFYYNADFEEIFNLDKTEQISFINKKFLKYKNKYRIE